MTPADSTTKTIEVLSKGYSNEFWNTVKELTDSTERESTIEHILSSDTPAWMYSLSRLAFKKQVPLNREFFKFVSPRIELYPNVIKFLKNIKSIENSAPFKNNKLKIHHFVVSAGLKELVEECLPTRLITWIFGCRYKIVYMNEESKEQPESVPVFCMDETMKTRSIFEIVKGTFDDTTKGVNIKRKDEDLWSPFSNIIYIGDGPTDIPALSLVRSKGGIGIGVYNSNESLSKVKSKLKQMSLDQRADLITKSDFSLKGELFEYIKDRCHFILKKYEATNIETLK